MKFYFKIMKMFNLKSLFSIPNKPGALPSKHFLTEEQEKEDVFTWEKWEVEIKKKYPIRYFLSEILPCWFSKYIYGNFAPIPRFWYWLRCHTFTKYHILDLRQPKNSVDEYRYGYTDIDHRILYACFNLLKIYVEKQKPYDLRKDYTDVEIEKDFGMNNQQKVYDEVMLIYNYWTIDRQNSRKELDEEFERIYKLKNIDRIKYNELYSQYRIKEKSFDDKEDEILIRLMKIRRNLWI